MENVSSFLQKFKKILFSKVARAEIAREAIQKELGIVLEAEKIEVKNGVVHVNVSPAIKNAIFLKKKKILELIAAQGTRVSDIR